MLWRVLLDCSFHLKLYMRFLGILVCPMFVHNPTGNLPLYFQPPCRDYLRLVLEPLGRGFSVRWCAAGSGLFQSRPFWRWEVLGRYWCWAAEVQPAGSRWVGQVLGNRGCQVLRTAMVPLVVMNLRLLCAKGGARSDSRQSWGHCAGKACDA